MKNIMKAILFTAVSVTALVACNKKGDSAPAQPAPIVQNCVVGQVQPGGMMCVNGQLVANPMGNLLNNVEFTTSYLSAIVSIGASGATTGMDLSNPEAVYYYSGQVSVSGSLQVLSGTLCGAPVGSYSVQGTGNIWSGAMSGLNLTISGPASMTLMVPSATVYNTNGLQRDATGNRMGIFNGMLTVNGVPCGSVTTY